MHATMTGTMVACLAAAATAQQLGLTVDPTGHFSITLDGTEWLSGSEYAVDDATVSAGTLKIQGAPTKGTGTDVFGAYESTTTTWTSTSSPSPILEASFRTYTNDPGMIVFEQKFPQQINAPPVTVGDDTNYKCRVSSQPAKLVPSVNGYTAYTVANGVTTPHPHMYCSDGHQYAFTSKDVNETECAAACAKVNCTCYDYTDSPSGGGGGGGGSGSASRTLFPGFARNSGPSDSKPAFAYHGVFPHMETTTVSDYKQSHQGGSPLVIYDNSKPTLPMVVFSPLNYPKAHHMTSSSSFIGAGVKDTVTEIPAGWSQMFVLSAGTGISNGMMAWGDRMLKFTGKPRADKYRDVTHSTIGFWTDNGGYYHYATGEKNATYEEVLPKVKAYHDSIGVPFGHWQFDSWFYPKDGGVNAGGGGGSVVNWTAMPSVFPSGMAGINKKLDGMPMVMHNRQWSDKSDYIKNWKDIQWYEDKYAIPMDPTQFFTRFFTQQQGWGLTMYEQDWMCTEYDGVAHLQTNITLADAWLEGMAAGAASSNRTVQYCMPYPNDLLAASSHAAVTNARATGDYFHGTNQWAVGHTSLFYWAIGVLPFKDGFYSSTNPQIGGQTVGPEKNPDRETIMAVLSTAMVGPMDGINLLNKSRVMATCRADGTVLKPDRPVHVSDTCFMTSSSGDPASCWTYYTWSNVSGLGTVYYLYDDDGKATTTPATVGLASAGSHAVFNFYTKEVAALQATNTIEPGYEGHIYAAIVPVVNGWAFVGEADKYVTAASIRFESVTSSGSGLTAQVVGVPNDSVSVCAASTSDWKLVCKTLSFTSHTTQSVSFP